MQQAVQRKSFSVNEYHKMIETGILGEDDHLELIKGDIINMAAIGCYHAACVDKLNMLFMINLAGKVIVRVQNPIVFEDKSEPEPDISLVKPRTDFYAKKLPGPEDVFLIIEVADTPIGYDRESKIPIYAGAGIQESWLVNLTDICVEVYTEPDKGDYRNIRKYKKGDIIRPVEFPDMKIEVSDIFG